MPWRLSTTTRNATGDGLVDQLDSGGTATIQIRTGVQPTTANDTATGSLLATLTCGSTAFAAFASGAASAEAISSGTALLTGAAGHARWLNGDGTTHSDMDIGEGSGTISFDDVDFLDGGTVSMTSVALTMPAE